ncbi:hypothetical protein PAA26_04445 [Methanomassiliicoccaceae archaeon COG_1]|nr:hypothetical protein [Methanomassiliicoccaceae archaeon COG_1]
MTQLTLELREADPSLTVRHNGDAARTYRFKGCTSVANLVDQLSLVTGRTKSEVVADSVRLAALFVKAAGPAALGTVAECGNPSGLPE